MELRLDLPERVGSIHKLSDGYGRGLRVPTARNLVGERIVPHYREPTTTELPVTGSKSRTRNLSSETALARNQQQIRLQTSGDYGKFTFGILEPAAATVSSSGKWQKKKQSQDTIAPVRSKKFLRRASILDNNDDDTPPRGRYQPRANLVSTQELRVFTSAPTLPSVSARALDKTFPSHSKYDFIASQTDVARNKDILLAVRTNEQSHLATSKWQLGLRN